MSEVRNLNNKRICDISKDKTHVVIKRDGCETHITANPDGTLNVVHTR